MNHAIHFSGGRSSGYMLHLLLDNIDNSISDDGDIAVIFCNTGKEFEPTLTFVQDVAEYWSIPIKWLEYDGKNKYKKVTYNTASRNGEPFDKLIEDKKGLPGNKLRFCTQELKVNTAKRYIENELGWDKYISYLGVRYDEKRRWLKILKEECNSRMPLVTNRVTKDEVLEFWNRQDFNLEMNSIYSNCDLCYLKGKKLKTKTLQQFPDSAVWWANKELEVSLLRGRMVTFNNKHSYLDIIADSHKYAGDFENFDEYEFVDCYCGD